MRILELHIRNVRGIRDVILAPNAENFVVWGPNGAGKSAVIDALDFLLTGSIKRLRGTGTQHITLREHGPHIDATPSEARVEALVQVACLPHPVRLARSIDTPSEIECPEEERGELEPLLRLAGKGQHILTRREILTFITAEAGERARQIQALLDMAPIEGIRRALVTVKNDLATDLAATRSACDRARGRVASHVGTGVYDAAATLAHLNQLRTTLGADELDSLDPVGLKTGVTPPTAIRGAEGTTDPAVAALAIASIRDVLATQEAIRAHWVSLKSSLEEISQDPYLLSEMEIEGLVRTGMSILGDGTACPLCGTLFAPDELQEQLRGRLDRAARASQLASLIEQSANALRAAASTLTAALTIVVDTAGAIVAADVAASLRDWADMVSTALQTLTVPIPCEMLHWEPASADALLPPEASNWLEQTERAIAALPASVTPQQSAWDALTRIQEALEACRDSERECVTAERLHSRAVALHDRFGHARDQAVQATYDAIRGRFEELYRELHAHEAGFGAELQPEGAGLALRVDFHGRGMHPPHALHSEGHQDSMGICLFLALTERLTSGAIDLIMLDDVMMSVDNEHRRALARLLATAFPDRQLLITTHDRSWAGQLVTEGVVRSRTSYHFADWSVESGPRLVEQGGLWEKLAADLEADEIPTAAHRLRRGAEDYLSQVCDSLGAPVRYRLSGAVELGDLAPGAMAQYKRLLKEGKASGQSWGDQDVLDRLAELESVASQVFQRTQIEQWAVNENVHYNAWSNHSAEDFRPVAEAFSDLFGLFACAKCGAILQVSRVGPTPTTVSCPCGAQSWSLLKRP